MKIASESKQGSKTTFFIEGASKEQCGGIVRCPVTERTDGYIEVRAGNKREAADVRSAVENANRPQNNKQTAQASHNRRYIESLEVAERNGLNHGRAWFCNEMDIETKGANPSFEGQMICYVYC